MFFVRPAPAVGVCGPNSSAAQRPKRLRNRLAKWIVNLTSLSSKSTSRGTCNAALESWKGIVREAPNNFRRCQSVFRLSLVCIHPAGGGRNTETGNRGGTEGQMDGREAKANNFALLYTRIEVRRAHKNAASAGPEFHNETLSIFSICRHKIRRLRSGSS